MKIRNFVLLEDGFEDELYKFPKDSPKDGVLRERIKGKASFEIWYHDEETQKKPAKESVEFYYDHFPLGKDVKWQLSNWSEMKFSTLLMRKADNLDEIIQKMLEAIEEHLFQNYYIEKFDYINVWNEICEKRKGKYFNLLLASEKFFDENLSKKLLNEFEYEVEKNFLCEVTRKRVMETLREHMLREKRYFKENDIIDFSKLKEIKKEENEGLEGIITINFAFPNDEFASSFETKMNFIGSSHKFVELVYLKPVESDEEYNENSEEFKNLQGFIKAEYYKYASKK